MFAKVIKIAGWAVLGLTIVGFASEAIGEIKEETSEEMEETNALDKTALFCRKIVKKGFEKDKNDCLLIKNQYDKIKEKDPQAAKEALAWGLGAGALYYIGLFIYKSKKRRTAHA